MATVHLFSNFYFDRLEPGLTYGYWQGPVDAYRNATITVTAHAFEGIGPTESLTMRTEIVGLENKPPAAERIVLLTLPTRAEYQFAHFTSILAL